jgi:aryl-alcohol dehydrogenase-like predicted oxidoreductase
MMKKMEVDMIKRVLGNTGLSIVPLVFGGNVFGWTIDEKQSFAVLDAFVDHGFNAIDTADVYSSWAPGNKGGESETILGRWFKARPGARNKVTLFTKVGSDLGKPGKKGLGTKWIGQAIVESLARLNTDVVDLYFSHRPDPDTPFEETLGAFQMLLAAGKIRAVGASNVSAGQLAEALQVARDRQLPRYQVIQSEYNLCNRAGFDGPLRDLCIKEGLGVVTYYALASGFLSGKYRSKADLGKSKRGEGVAKFLDDRGLAVLKALDEVAAGHRAKPAEVALSWLIHTEGVTAPIASATSVEHVESFARALELKLSAADMAFLNQTGG